VPAYKVLTDEQVQSFLDNGYLIVKHCVDLDFAQRWIKRGFERLGFKQDDPTTWAKDMIWMKCESEVAIRDIAPRAWAALLDVVGGEERLETQVMDTPASLYPVTSFRWSDALIINLRRGADRPWQPPSAQTDGWHKDGGYFKHFLDSPEQGLLTIVCWTDMRHQGGGTFVAPDSIGVVARYMLEHPDGIDPNGFEIQKLLDQCTRFEELTGEAGDFIILHPYMLHASSQNVLGKPRIITNPPVWLKEPFNFHRANPDDYSLVERATLKALGVDHLDFQPAAPREGTWWPMAAE
jgi:hypothetical protein